MRLLAHWLREAEVFACADAAGLPHEHLPRRPDLVIGDFDTLFQSVGRGCVEASPAAEGDGDTVYRHITDQDSSDGEKALCLLIGEGVEEIVMLGGFGGRLDHSLYNLSLLERFDERARLCLVDEHGVTLRVSPGTLLELDLPAGTGFSLLPLGEAAEGVLLEGARWPLPGGRVATGGPSCISNRIEVAPLRLSLARGALLLFVALAPDDERPSD